ncbi:MAG: hypothetical protein JNL62_09785 [Bryobacterales bacterium]|nr:hypothetical protein [Bryobacterales bacterium]
MHASETDLALYVGGDLGLWARFRIRRHVSACAACSARHRELVEARAALREIAAELPAELDWERLSAEMRANIHLGLAAGECVATPQERTAELTGWRPAAVLAGAALVVAVAWYANHLQPVTPTNMVQVKSAPKTEGVLLESSASGLEWKEEGHTLTLKHPKDQDVAFTATLDSVRARYVDRDSGQVTINHVYAQ